MGPNSTVNYEPLAHMNRVKVGGNYINGPAVSSSFITIGALLFFFPLFAAFSAIISIILVVVGLYLGYLSSIQEQMTWRRFASANRWGVIPIPNSRQVFVVPPCMQFGHSWQTSEMIRGRIGDAPFDMFEYAFTIGRGKSSTTYISTVMTLPTAVPLPRILLDSKTNKGGAYKHKFEDSEALELEGNFNETFRLQIAKGSHIDALAIMTPDVMQSILDYGHLFDIEIKDTSIHIISVNDQRTTKDLPKFIEGALAVYTQLTEKIQRYNSAQASHSFVAPALTQAELSKEVSASESVRKAANLVLTSRSPLVWVAVVFILTTFAFMIIISIVSY